jgi:hypothetical protein
MLVHIIIQHPKKPGIPPTEVRLQKPNPWFDFLSGNHISEQAASGIFCYDSNEKKDET